MTSFLALPFLFPILMILGVVLLVYPLAGALATCVRSVRAYFTLRSMFTNIFSRRETAAIVVGSCYDIIRRNLLDYVRFLGKAVKVSASWVYTVLVGLLFLPVSLLQVAGEQAGRLIEWVSYYTSIPARPAMRSIGQ